MKNMTLANILKATGGTAVNFEPDDSREIQGAVIDSRLVGEDYLFFATPGAKVDGHDFIAGSFEKGALACVCERVPEGVTGPCIVVEDSFTALKKTAAFYRENLEIKVVGVTGSVGKTSTKEFIASVLSVKFNVLKTDKNFNNEVGLPLTVLKIRNEHEIAVLEMGISDFGEMTRLSEIAKPDIAVITNIGDCHLEKLGDRDGVLKAKTEIFKNLSSGGFVCLFGDDEKLSTVRDVNGTAPYFYGLGEKNDVRAENVVNKGLFGSEAVIVKDGERIPVSIPLPGHHMVINALAAATVASIFGLTGDEIKDGISKVESLGGRSHIVSKNELTIIDDCYNANPVSVKAALDLLCEAVTPKVAILGDMFELGENEEVFHKSVGEYAVTKPIDTLVFIGRLSKCTYLGAVAAKGDAKTPECLYFPDKEKFIAEASKVIKKDDSVLIKASHGMEFEKIVEHLTSDEIKGTLSPRTSKLFDGDNHEDYIEIDKSKEGRKERRMKKKKGEETIFESTVSKEEEKDRQIRKITIIGVIAVVLILAGIIAFVSFRASSKEKLTRGVIVYPGDGLAYDRASDGNIATDGENFYFNEDGNFIFVNKKDRVGTAFAINESDCFKCDENGRLYYVLDGKLRESNEKDFLFRTLDDDCASFDFTEDGKSILIYSTDGDVSLVNKEKDTEKLLLCNDCDECLEASADGKRILAESNGELHAAFGNGKEITLCDSYEEYVACVKEDLKSVYFRASDGTLGRYVFGKKKAKHIFIDVKEIYEIKGDEERILVRYSKEGSERLALCVKGKVMEIPASEGLIPTGPIAFSKKDNAAVFMAESGDKSILYKVGLSGSDKGKIVFTDENVVSVENLDGDVAYTCRPNMQGSFSLCADDATIIFCIIPGTATRSLDGKCIMYLDHGLDTVTNPLSEDSEYSLYCYDGKKSTPVDIIYGTEYVAVSAKEVYYIRKNASYLSVTYYDGVYGKSLADDACEYKYLRY